MPEIHTLYDVQKAVNDEVSRDLCPRLGYTTLEAIAIAGLTEEAGEVAGVYKRYLRRNARDKDIDFHARFKEELGDLMWYMAMTCCAFGVDMDSVWTENRRKLEERYGYRTD